MAERDEQRPQTSVPEIRSNGGSARTTSKSKSTENKMAGKTSGKKRELTNPQGDKRFIRRGDGGRIAESDDVGRSLAKDVKQAAKKKVPKGQGDKGDQRSKK